MLQYKLARVDLTSAGRIDADDKTRMYQRKCRRVQRMVRRLVSPLARRVAGSWAESRRRVVEQWKELGEESRQRFGFMLASLASTVLFVVIFECLFIVLMEFTAAYTLAYLAAVFWQHTLNHMLVFRATGNYCEGLVQTYFVYSFSLLISSMFGVIMVKRFAIRPRVVSFVTLPVTGIGNYYMLKTCMFRGSSGSSPETVPLDDEVKPISV